MEKKVVAMDVEVAVDIKNVEFYYKNNVKVLNGLALKIPKGNIFALLGPNGCGKTTLIRMILGRLQASGGTINLFGVTPGSEYSDIPGVGVGYMPQELALYPEFTINEILIYYGIIYGIKSEEMNKRIEDLIQLLHLPEKSRPISQLSGGQQRLVSIAIAMIHKPKLIILDEPTVGVDSLLRHQIWQYLQTICTENGQTVLITTHYIDEAKSASNVGFMNYGSVLKQSDPQQLLREYKCQTLEEVFLLLCNQRMDENESTDKTDPPINEIDFESKNKSSGTVRKKSEKGIHLNINNIKAILWKYYILTVRKPIGLVIIYLIPFFVISFLKLTFGKNLHNISLGVYNADLNPEYSQQFIDSIDRNYVKLNEYSTKESAVESVVKGNNYMSIVFGQNYSDAFETRWLHTNEITEQELHESQLKIYADFSMIPNILFIYKKLFSAFILQLEAFDLKFDLKSVQYIRPLVFQEVIYGDFAFDFAVHVVPGELLWYSYLIPTLLSGLQIIIDRTNDSFERVFVAGVQPIDQFIAHFVINVLIIIPQVLATTIMTFVIYDWPQAGSYFEVFSFLFLQGIQGISLGLMIALLVSDMTTFSYLSVAFHLTLFMLTSIFWTIESLPTYLKYISVWSPLTQPVDGLRAVLTRGWDWSRPTVYFGYMVSIGYTLLFSVLDIILFNTFTDKSFSMYNKN